MSEVKISGFGGKDSKGCGKVSAIDECCWVERRSVSPIQDNLWLEGDPGFPIRQQCFLKHQKTPKIDKKYGLCYSRKKKKKKTMCELPDDLVEEILYRIEATSLKRLQSTSRAWNHLINCRRFTIEHFDKAPRQSLNLMLSEVGFYSISINLHRPVEFTGKIDLIYPHSSLDKRTISQYCHSDGLLLCVCVKDMFDFSNQPHGFDIANEDAKLVVWNPCTGETKCIQAAYPATVGYIYSLGSYQNKNSKHRSYKILGHRDLGTLQEFDIYEVSSNSCRILYLTLDCKFEFSGNVSLKGTTYWFASDEKEKQLGIFLLTFDYTTETFGRLRLPYQHPTYQTMSLSLVGEEKLSVLLQPQITSKTEVWVTNKIGETKMVSWIKVLAVDLKPGLDTYACRSFLVDEEKKVLMYCAYLEVKRQNIGYIVGEDNEVREEPLGLEFSPFLLNYVPSLTQIANLSAS